MLVLRLAVGCSVIEEPAKQRAEVHTKMPIAALDNRPTLVEIRLREVFACRPVPDQREKPTAPLFDFRNGFGNRVFVAPEMAMTSNRAGRNSMPTKVTTGSSLESDLLRDQLGKGRWLFGHVAFSQLRFHASNALLCMEAPSNGWPTWGMPERGEVEGGRIAHYLRSRGLPRPF